MKNCPFCRQPVMDETVICPYCQRGNLNPKEKAATIILLTFILTFFAVGTCEIAIWLKTAGGGLQFTPWHAFDLSNSTLMLNYITIALFSLLICQTFTADLTEAPSSFLKMFKSPGEFIFNVLCLLIIWQGLGPDIISLLISGGPPEITVFVLLSLVLIWILLNRIIVFKKAARDSFAFAMISMRSFFNFLSACLLFFFLVFVCHHQIYQDYMKNIFERYVLQPKPANVKLINGVAYSWLDLSVKMAFITDDKTFQKISASFTKIQDPKPDPRNFVRLPVPSSYYYRENKPAENLYVLGYFSRDDRTGETYFISHSGNISYAQEAKLFETGKIPKNTVSSRAIRPQGYNPISTLFNSHKYQAYLRAGDYPAAITEISYRLNFRESGFSPQDEKKLLLQRGDLFITIGEYQKALEDYSRALEINRNQANGTIIQNQSFIDAGTSLSLLKRGTAYRKLEKLDLALADLNQAISENPDSRVLYDCYIQRGLTYKSLNKDAEFHDDFKKAELSDRNLAEGFYALIDHQWIMYGKFVWYFPDGKVRTECDYVNGQVSGKCKYYNPDGSAQ